MESGLDGNTKIKLNNGEVKLKNIKPGDILFNNDKVLATVLLDATDLTNVNKFTINKTTIIGGPNIFLNHDSLGNFTTLNCKNLKKVKVNKLFNLVTESGHFYVKDIKIQDYNSGIENNLDIKEKLHMMF